MTQLRVMVKFVTAFLILLASALPALAVDLISAPDARAAVERGEIVLVDVRTPSEWKATGIADVATPISMADRAFGQNLQALVEANPDKRIAFICATGGRTAFLTRELERLGLAGTIDVSEGMMGSRAGPGWLRRGLPVRQP